MCGGGAVRAGAVVTKLIIGRAHFITHDTVNSELNIYKYFVSLSHCVPRANGLDRLCTTSSFQLNISRLLFF